MNTLNESAIRWGQPTTHLQQKDETGEESPDTASLRSCNTEVPHEPTGSSGTDSNDVPMNDSATRHPWPQQTLLNSRPNSADGTMMPHRRALHDTGGLSSSNHSTGSLPPGGIAVPTWQHQQQQQQQCPESCTWCCASMVTIGLGVNTGQTDGHDATEAALRALQDALNRGVLRLGDPKGSRPQRQLQMHIKLGVPTNDHDELMDVDVQRLMAEIPSPVSVLPVQIVVGGISMEGSSSEDSQPFPGICAVVACVSLREVEVSSMKETVPVDSTDKQIHRKNDVVRTPTSATINETIPGEGMDKPIHRVNDIMRAPNSMDILAEISEVVRTKSQERLTKPQQQQQTLPSSPSIDPVSSGGFALHGFHGSFDLGDGSVQTSARVARKLAPGVTAKNNRRQFVQHKYTDHAYDRPTPTDGALVLAGKAANTAFPIKLHEILNKVEKDGYNHVISWQPHGRSFKIHKQDEFAQLILPQYFVMTKKSSFLRQLNLYGFNRLSAGPDKGAYYHELFLRGMPFLCRRMTRMKINGHGIRAAGNPEQEPNFYNMPQVPIHGSSLTLSSTTATTNTVNNNINNNTTSNTSITALTTAASATSMEGASGSSTTATLITTSSGEDMDPRGEVRSCFPLKLQAMLDKLEEEGNTDFIAWLPHGRGFMVYKPDDFVKELMPKYFRQTK